MAGYFYDPRVQALDSSGATVAGATLTFYDDGTTTPKDTFSDEGLTTPNGNPMTADGSGRFTPIYLQNTAYTVILKDADGVTVWTQDNIDGAALNPATGGIAAVVDDTSPQLGGFLDTNGFAIDESEGTAVVSAASIDIWAEDGNTIHLTGNTGPITDLGTAAHAGAVRWVICDSTPTFTHSANLNLPGGVDFTAAAGDMLRVYADATTQFDVTVFKASGRSTISSIIQIVETTDGTVATGTTILPGDNTIPQNTEGDEYMTRVVTPKSATNILIIDVNAALSTSDDSGFVSASLFQDTTADALKSTIGRINGAANCPLMHHLQHQMVAGTTLSITFKIRAGSDAAGTTTFNGFNAGQLYGGVMNSYIRITEISA